MILDTGGIDPFYRPSIRHKIALIDSDFKRTFLLAHFNQRCSLFYYFSWEIDLFLLVDKNYGLWR